MKRSIALAVSIALMCLLMAGCALFRTHRGGAAKNGGTAESQAGASIQGGVSKSNSGSNQVAPATGAVATNTSGGQVTNSAAGGTGPGPGGTDTGASTNEAGSGHTLLFYFFILFAGAMVGWISGTLWHNYQRHRRGEPPERYEHPAA